MLSAISLPWTIRAILVATSRSQWSHKGVRHNTAFGGSMTLDSVMVKWPFCEMFSEVSPRLPAPRDEKRASRQWRCRELKGRGLGSQELKVQKDQKATEVFVYLVYLLCKEKYVNQNIYMMMQVQTYRLIGVSKARTKISKSIYMIVLCVLLLNIPMVWGARSPLLSS